MSEKVGVIICAGGASERFGGKRKKPFVDVAGRAVFLRSVELFANREDVKQILLAITAEDEELVEVKWGANLKFFNVQTCIGGAERCDTVKNALKLIRDDIDLIAVHDAVRCCVKQSWIDEVLDRAAETGAAILASPVVATLKKVESRQVIETVQRDGLYEAQTPQVFKAELLKRAYNNITEFTKSAISDDAQLVEGLGHKIAIVETDSSNIKITHRNDIAIAEAILRSRPKPKPQGPMGPYIEAKW